MKPLNPGTTGTPAGKVKRELDESASPKKPKKSPEKLQALLRLPEGFRV